MRRSGVMIFNQNNRGVTFIEVMIGITILAMVGFGGLRAFTLGTELTNVTTQKIVAAQHAQERLEQVKQDIFINIINANYPNDVVIIDDSNTQNTGIDDLLGNRVVVITDLINTKDVSVTVQWNWQGKTYAETLRTLVGRN